MKLLTYRSHNCERAGMLVGDNIIDLALGHASARTSSFLLGELPTDMVQFLRLGTAAMNDAALIEKWAANKVADGVAVLSADSVELSAPITRPPSMRDGYAFRQHVEAARRNRGVEMIPEFDEIPIFYFTNHQAVYGPGNIPVLPMHLNQLDFELECAVVIGKQGRNIKVSEADDYIAGYTVMNDWSARALQMHEMKLNLGPAKGKDFATSIGPWLVTREELAPYKIQTEVGEKYDLEMTCVINGKHVSSGNVKDMSWTFAQIIERASYGVTLYPGDVIGSGTCGTGCFLELNGSKVYDPAWWLTTGDVVTCSIDALGSLTNTVVAEL